MLICWSLVWEVFNLLVSCQWRKHSFSSTLRVWCLQTPQQFRISRLSHQLQAPTQPWIRQWRFLSLFQPIPCTAQSSPVRYTTTSSKASTSRWSEYLLSRLDSSCLSWKRRERVRQISSRKSMKVLSKFWSRTTSSKVIVLTKVGQKRRGKSDQPISLIVPKQASILIQRSLREWTLTMTALINQKLVALSVSQA